MSQKKGPVVRDIGDMALINPLVRGNINERKRKRESE